MYKEVEKPTSINRLQRLIQHIGGDKARGVKSPWSNATPLGQRPSFRSYSLREEGQTFSIYEEDRLLHPYRYRHFYGKLYRQRRFEFQVPGYKEDETLRRPVGYGVQGGAVIFGI